MNQPSEGNKYQLWPTKDKTSISPERKSPDPETAFALAMGRSGSAMSDRSDRQMVGSRTKAREGLQLRRRKISVPELGPMTTVQEVCMDSREFLPGKTRNCHGNEIRLMTFL
jgi:hypothetical protein